MVRLAGSVIVFALALVYFGSLAAPAQSWANGASDAADYLGAARYFMVSHAPSGPVYNIIAHYWLVIFGSVLVDARALTLLSSASAALAAAMLYAMSGTGLTVLVYMASMLVVGQATIIDLNAMVIAGALTAFWLHRAGHHTLKYLPLAACQVFGIIYGMVFFAWDTWREERPAWKSLLPFGLSLTPYLYIFIANTPSPWLADKGVGSYLVYFKYASGMSNGLPIWPIGEAALREISLVILMVTSYGAALVPITIAVWESLRWRDWILPAFALLPALYFATSTTQDTFAYMAFGAPFMALLAHEGLDHIPWALGVIVVGAVALILFNGSTMQIGRTLDSELAAQAFYDALDTLPDGAAIDTDHKGWELQSVNYYNLTHNRRIDNLWEPAHLATREQRTAVAIAEGRLYRTRTLDPVTLETTIEKVK